MTKLTKALAVQFAKMAILEKGKDYVYPGSSTITWKQHCFYVDETTGKPSCIVGQIIVKAGGSLSNVIEGTCPEEAVEDAGLDSTPAAIQFLNDIQNRQDRGETWGDALKGALA